MKELNTNNIKSLDRSDMLGLLLGFPKQLEEAKAIGEAAGFSLKGKYTKIVFSGLGGSAIGADLIRTFVAGECKKPVFVNRDYTLPAFVDKDTLLIISSYSGNTEETLSAYDEGVKRGAKIIAITTNGELKKRAKKDGFPCVVIPGGLPPRCALGYSSIPLIVLFSKSGLIKDKSAQIDEAAIVLEKLSRTVLSPDVGEEKNIAKKIAKALLDKYAIIYGAGMHIDVVATRWRGQLAENSKAVSSTHLFPEMNHNEIVGWDNPKGLMKDLVAVFLRDGGDHPRVGLRMDISKKIIEKTGAKIIEVRSQGQTLLARIFSLIYIGDFISLYLAVLNNTDPTPVDSVTYLKNELAKV